MIHALEDLSPRTMLEALAKAGVARVMVEAGPSLSHVFLSEHMVDRLYWYKAPHALGRSETPLLEAIAKTPRQSRSEQLMLGADSLEIIEFNSCLPD